MAVGLEFESSIIKLENEIEKLQKLETEGKVNFKPEIQKLLEKRDSMIKEVYSKLNPWQVTQIARHPKRPLFSDYIEQILDGFVELHGDRNFGDDKSIVAGFAKMDKKKVMVIGHMKGKNTKENIMRNFGLPKPEGYRKALRLMKLAEKFNIPIITFIDTQGAYPGMEGEERGQSEAIATNLFEMSSLKVPIIAVVIGEGGSGGALALGVADKVMMLSNSIYSVISPEGCASILWKDAGMASKAAESLKITASDLFKYGLIDEIIQEPLGGAHRNYEKTTESVKKAILTKLKSLNKLSVKKLLEKRYEKLTKMGNDVIIE